MEDLACLAVPTMSRQVKMNVEIAKIAYLRFSNIVAAS
jgi:hypothetical protein